MIVGLTGKFAAGKGTVAEVLRVRGFVYHSLSDVIRDELAARGLPESRENLTATGNAMRRADGPAALALRITPRLADGRDHIVDSIRNPAEVEVLRTVPGFFLLGVDAEQRVRFERLRARNRTAATETFAQFAELEARETHSTDPTTQQLHATWQLADVVVSNDTTLDALAAAVGRVLAERGRPLT